jgi:hypothetical protein
MMDHLAFLYPTIGLRRPLPALLGPAAQALTIVPWLFPKKHGRVMATFPLLLGLVLARPCFTAGSPLDDYNSASQFFCSIATYLDFIVLRPTTEEAPRWIGQPKGLVKDGEVSEADVEAEGVSIDDERASLWDRFKLALRLSLYGRGIGWNWVSGVRQYFNNSTELPSQELIIYSSKSKTFPSVPMFAWRNGLSSADVYSWPFLRL